MKVSTFLNIHTNPELVFDTVDSIKTFVSKDILLVIDGCSSEFSGLKMPASYISGFNHGFPRSPYRNLALGLKQLTEM